MDLIEIREYCLSKPFVKEDFPFDEVTLVFKVFDKMFALIDIDSVPFWMNLKAAPEDCIRLRESYDFISAGYHMNKKYWITVRIVNNIADNFLKELIDNSYNEVVRKLPKYKQKLIIERLSNESLQ